MRGDIPPDDALAVLSAFEQRLKQITLDQQHLADAKTALQLDYLDTDRTVGIHAELTSLKDAWAAVRNIWKAMGELKETPWVNLQYRKVTR